MKVLFLKDIGCITHSGYHHIAGEGKISIPWDPKEWQGCLSQWQARVMRQARVWACSVGSMCCFVCQTQPGDGPRHLSIICGVCVAEVIPHMTFLLISILSKHYLTDEFPFWWFVDDGHSEPQMFPALSVIHLNASFNSLFKNWSLKK